MDLATMATMEPGKDVATAHIVSPMENSIHASLRRMDTAERQAPYLLSNVMVQEAAGTKNLSKPVAAVQSQKSVGNENLRKPNIGGNE